MSQKFLLNISRNDVCLSSRESAQSFSEPRPIFGPAVGRCYSTALGCSGAHSVSTADALCSQESCSFSLSLSLFFFFFFEKGWGEETLNRKKIKTKQTNWTDKTSHHPTNFYCSHTHLGDQMLKFGFIKNQFLTSLSSLLIHYNTYKILFFKLCPSSSANWTKTKKEYRGVPIVTQWLRTMRLQVQSVPLLSGLTIRHYRELWCRLQTWLGSRVAVALA